MNDDIEETVGVANDIAEAPLYSEEALALMFAERHADKLRFVAEWSQWFTWDGTCWRKDKTRTVFSLARELCREVANTCNSPNDRKRIASAKTRAAVVTLAAEDRRLVATVDQWDADPWLLNTPDGVVDLRTGKPREHQLEDYMTKQAAVSPKGACPLWLKFLKEITGGDKDLQGYLQRVAGYCLTGVTYEQELFFFYGSGGNGKGVWVQTISGILGDYHKASSIETFTVSQSERHPTEIAKLLGARLVTAAETEQGRRWSEARIKELTGGDKISARFMRQDLFEFFPQFKLVFSGNSVPKLRTVNKAITRRFNRVPFEVTIADNKVNEKLGEELKTEWPGILAWAVAGCLQWQRDGLRPPKAVTEATESYLESQDILGAWLEECFERDANAWTSTTDLFDSWRTWAEERQEWVGSVNDLSARLEDRGGFRKCKNKKQTARGFAGLRVKPREPRNFFKR
jgi:putative DNA primase/helicase